MKRIILFVISAMILAGCAANSLSYAEKTSVIEGFITSEKLEHRNSVSAFNIDGWTSLSDQYLIIRTSGFKAHLVKLMTRCQDISFAPRVLIQTRFSNSLSAGFDSVYSPDNQNFKCIINKIYPLSREQEQALVSALKTANENKLMEKTQNEEEDNKLTPNENNTKSS